MWFFKYRGLVLLLGGRGRGQSNKSSLQYTLYDFDPKCQENKNLQKLFESKFRKLSPIYFALFLSTCHSLAWVNELYLRSDNRPTIISALFWWRTMINDCFIESLLNGSKCVNGFAAISLNGTWGHTTFDHCNTLKHMYCSWDL